MEHPVTSHEVRCRRENYYILGRENYCKKMRNSSSFLDFSNIEILLTFEPLQAKSDLWSAGKCIRLAPALS